MTNASNAIETETAAETETGPNIAPGANFPLRALNSISRQLAPLTPEDRRRVLAATLALYGADPVAVA